MFDFLLQLSANKIILEPLNAWQAKIARNVFIEEETLGVSQVRGDSESGAVWDQHDCHMFSWSIVEKIVLREH